MRSWLTLNAFERCLLLAQNRIADLEPECPHLKEMRRSLRSIPLPRSPRRCRIIGGNLLLPKRHQMATLNGRP